MNSLDKQAFLDLVVPLAQKEARRSGILASLTIAQAIIESDWGRSILATNGFNFFGIKGDWLGKSITKNTGEFINGQAIRVDAAFRAYPDAETGFMDHSNFLRRSHYSKVWWETDYKKACFEVWDAGYATSPTYATTLVNCINGHQLYRYDVPMEVPMIEPLAINKGIVQGNNIEGVPFSARIVKPKNKNNVRTGIKLNEIIGLTIHNTANTRASAEDHASWLQSVENADSQYISVHFFVDENSIVQTVPVDEVCYHAGDGSGNGNRKTISIEICEDGNMAKAESNAQTLAAALIKTYPGIMVYKHQDWSGKFCPRVILTRNGWQDFRAGIYSKLDEAPEAKPPAKLVKVTTDVLNIRKGPGVAYQKTGQIKSRGIFTIVEVSGKWGKLKSGAGWIHLDYTSPIA